MPEPTARRLQTVGDINTVEARWCLPEGTVLNARLWQPSEGEVVASLHEVLPNNETRRLWLMRLESQAHAHAVQPLEIGDGGGVALEASLTVTGRFSVFELFEVEET